jgi:hypothetical protein
VTTNHDTSNLHFIHLSLVVEFLMNQPKSDDAYRFLPTENGLTNRLVQRIGVLGLLSGWRRVLLLVAAVWLPMLILSGLSGHATGHDVSVAFLHDPEVNCRLLIALPLLQVAGWILAYSLLLQVKELLHSGIVPKPEQGRFDAAVQEARRLHDSPVFEVILWIISFSVAILMRVVIVPDISSTWERHGGAITPAGWWHMVIALPVLFFSLLRILWVFVLWAWFLFRISRLQLQLTATHPDHAGGLGFLAWGLASFAPMLAAFSTVMSAGFAYEIYHRGESLDSLKYHLMVYVVLVTIIVHLPLLPFTGRLSRCRIHGLLEFSRLVWRHDRAFDEKWLHQPPSSIKEQLLGTSDVQSLADIATGYEHVNEMRLVLFDTKAATVLAVASVLPMLPLLGTAIPIHEIIVKLGELLV